MRLNLNQQSGGPTYDWHKNLIDSLIPIVDCGVHYVDVMCQLTGAKPVRVHGIGAHLWEDADKPNYGHLHVTFDDGSVGWYEAGWGPMMSEVAYFVKDVVGPRGAVSIVPNPKAHKDGVSDSSDIDQHTKTDAIQYHHAEVAPGDKSFVRKDEIFTMTDEPGHQDLCDREQAFFLRTINEDLDLSDSMDAAVNSLRIVQNRASTRSGSSNSPDPATSQTTWRRTSGPPRDVAHPGGTRCHCLDRSRISISCSKAVVSSTPATA
jgi:predicted dehydrogenase